MSGLLNAMVVEKFDSILARGLCSGIGERDGRMCIEEWVDAIAKAEGKR